MLLPGWKREVNTFQDVGFDRVVDQIDYVCQLAGHARQCALGTDLDGGFGSEQTPRELRRYRDLQKLADVLSARGYGDADIDGIYHGNWLRFFTAALPNHREGLLGTKVTERRSQEEEFETTDEHR
jgi:membrane dipeptidase